MKEEIEESGKSNEKGLAKKKNDYPQTQPLFELVVDGKTVRGFPFRSDAVAWAVNNESTWAFYHSGVWEVMGLDEEGFEWVKSHVGSPFETKVRDLVLEKFNTRV
jgi:hypothetical protein